MSLKRLGTKVKKCRSRGHKQRRLEALFIIPFVSHGESRINRKHYQQIMNHNPSRNVPHFWRHEHTTFSGFIKARERPHRGRGEDGKERTTSGRPERTQRNKYTDEEGESEKGLSSWGEKQRKKKIQTNRGGDWTTDTKRGDHKHKGELEKQRGETQTQEHRTKKKPRQGRKRKPETGSQAQHRVNRGRRKKTQEEQRKGARDEQTTRGQTTQRVKHPINQHTSAFGFVSR